MGVYFSSKGGAVQATEILHLPGLWNKDVYTAPTHTETFSPNKEEQTMTKKNKTVEFTSSCTNWGTITNARTMALRPKWQRIIGVVWRPWSKPQTIEGRIGDDPK